ncbi:MAG TPA: hypothetical protein VFY93_15370 [Planctomycetota bacterium]|nr:hypothetical protein [Planctomycetota bacterium]
MHVVSLSLVIVLAACASTKGAGPYPAAQEVVDRVAAKHADLVRLTLHAVPKGKTECTQLASTMAKRRGKPSDPEDRDAMRTGREIVLDEPGAIDVTVPILKKDGKATAIAGVTLPVASGADRNAVVGRARAIAAEVEAEVRAAGKPLW